MMGRRLGRAAAARWGRLPALLPARKVAIYSQRAQVPERGEERALGGGNHCTRTFGVLESSLGVVARPACAAASTPLRKQTSHDRDCASRLQRDQSEEATG